MQRFKDRLYDAYDELCCRVSFFFHRLTVNRRAPVPRREVIRGTSHSIIVVTPPNPEMFREAMFILSDEYMRSSSGSEALLRQAKLAAEKYAGQFVPPPSGGNALSVIVPILSACLGFALGLFIG